MSIILFKKFHRAFIATFLLSAMIASFPALGEIVPTQPLESNDDGIYQPKKKDSIITNITTPSQMSHDYRFKVLNFTPNTVYRVSLLYDVTTYFELEEGEAMTNIVMPKRYAWQITPTANKIFIRPYAQNADSTMTLMTNKRVYFFELSALEPTQENVDKHFSFYIKFRYPNNEQVKSIRTYASSLLPNLSNPEQYNFNYTVTGDKTIYPVKIFDNGKFTYFEFPENGSIPAIFAVDSNNYESIINFRVLGDYIVTESTSSRFTLRYGKAVACVFNENLWLSQKLDS